MKSTILASVLLAVGVCIGCKPSASTAQPPLPTAPQPTAPQLATPAPQAKPQPDSTPPSARTAFDGFTIELPKGWHKSPDAVSEPMTPGSINILKITPSVSPDPSPADAAMLSIESRSVDQSFSDAAFLKQLIGALKQAGGQASMEDAKPIDGGELQNARMVTPTPKGLFMYDLYTTTVPTERGRVFYSFYASCAVNRDGKVVANPDHVRAMLNAIKAIQIKK